MTTTTDQISDLEAQLAIVKQARIAELRQDLAAAMKTVKSIRADICRIQTGRAVPPRRRGNGRDPNSYRSRVESAVLESKTPVTAKDLEHLGIRRARQVLAILTAEGRLSRVGLGTYTKP